MRIFRVFSNITAIVVMAIVMCNTYVYAALPAAFAYIEPNSAVSYEVQSYAYRLNAEGSDLITETRIKVPAGVSGVSAMTSGMTGASVVYLAGEIIVTYATPWNVFSNPNSDVIYFEASSFPGDKYYGSYLNGDTDAAGNTPSGFSQYVIIKTATPTVTITPTISPTPTITLTVLGTYTITETFSVTPSITHTLTISNTPNWSMTETQTVTKTITGIPPSETITPTITKTSTQTFTSTSTKTSTATSTPTITITATPSITPTPTITITITIKGIDVTVSDFSRYSTTSGQPSIPLTKIDYLNIGGFQEDITGTIITINDYLGNEFNMSDIISNIYVVDSGSNTIFTSAAPALSSLTLSYVPPLTVPLQGTKSMYIYADIKNTTFTASFSAGVDVPDDVFAVVPVAAAASLSFPLHAEKIQLKNRTTVLEVYANDKTPPFVSTGQTDVLALECIFKNPAGVEYSAALINGVTITVKNSLDALIPADIAISRFEISDDDTVYYSSVTIPSLSQIYCAFAEPVTVEADSEKTVYIAVDVTGNTLSRAGEFKIAIDTQSDIDVSEYHYGMAVTTYAKAEYSFPLDTASILIQNSAEEVEVVHVDKMPISVSAGQQNVETMQLVLSNKGNTYTAIALLTRISLYAYDSFNNPLDPSLVLDKVYISDEDGTEIYGENSVLFDSRITINFSKSVGIPAASSVTVSVRADISAAYSVNSFKMNFISADDMYCVDGNKFTKIDVTSSTSFPKQSGLTVIQDRAVNAGLNSFASILPAGSMKGQTWIPVLLYTINNPNGTMSAPAEFTGMQLNIKNSAGNDIAANSVFENIYAVDSAGTTRAVAVPGVSTIVNLTNTTPLLIPQGSALSVSIFADVLTTASASDYKVTLEKDSSIYVRDSNSHDECNKIPDSLFPWETSISNIFSSPASSLVLGGVDKAPKIVGSGSQDVRMMALEFYNPGTTGIADVHIEGVTVTALDGLNTVISPSSALSSIRMINADNGQVFGSVDLSGAVLASPFYLDLSNVPLLVPASTTINAYLKTNISVSATESYFNLRIASENDFVAHSSPQGSISLVSSIFMPFPVETSGTSINSSAIIYMGHKDLRPISAEKGRTGVAMMDIIFENTNDFPIRVTSVAVALKDSGDSFINFNSVIAACYLVDSLGNTIAFASAPSSSNINISILSFWIPANTTDYITFIVDLNSSGEGAFYVEVEDALSVGTRPVTNINPMVGEFFGNMQSSTLSIQPDDFHSSVHGFPNPFNPSNGAARIEYYLSNDSVVTVRVFSTSGRIVKEVIINEFRSKGINNYDQWNGANELGKQVRSGVYFIQVEAKDGVTDKVYKKVEKLVLLR